MPWCSQRATGASLVQTSKLLALPPSTGMSTHSGAQAVAGKGIARPKPITLNTWPLPLSRYVPTSSAPRYASPNCLLLLRISARHTDVHDLDGTFALAPCHDAGLQMEQRSAVVHHLEHEQPEGI